MEAKEFKMESQMELRWKQMMPRWNPRWSSDGSKGIRDGIPDGTQTEAKEYKIDSQDRNQAIQVIQEEIPGT